MCGHRWSIVDVVTPPGFFFRICNETMKGRKEGGEGLNKKSRSKFPYPTLSALQFNAFSPPDFMFIRHRLLMESVCQRINWRRSVREENFRYSNRIDENFFNNSFRPDPGVTSFSSSREFTFTRIDLFLSLSLLFGTRIEGTIRRKSCFIRFIEKGLDLILFIQLIKLKKPRIIFKGWSRALKRINLPGDRDKIKKRDKVEEGEFVRSIRRARRSNSILGSRVTRHGDGSTFLPSFLEFPLCLGYLCARGWTAPSIDFETVFALTSGFNFCPVSASFGREKKGLDENHDRLTQIFRLVQIFIRLSAWLAPFVLSPFLSFPPPPSSFSFYF